MSFVNHGKQILKFRLFENTFIDLTHCIILFSFRNVKVKSKHLGKKFTLSAAGKKCLNAKYKLQYSLIFAVH